MRLTISQIQNAHSDEELLKLLQTELNAEFPEDSRRDMPVFLSRLSRAPAGLRAMAATFDLDVSMALDDLAWHFVNHPDLDLYEETRAGLRELGTTECAELFEKTLSILQPHWDEFVAIAQENDTTHAASPWLEKTGIQKQIEPLNDQMWKLLHQWPEHGLMHYWADYARKHPERCVVLPE